MIRFRHFSLSFFVAHNIPFSVFESKEFKELIKTLRPAFVSAGGMPTRKKMAGAFLGNFFDEVKAKVDAFFQNLCERWRQNDSPAEWLGEY